MEIIATVSYIEKGHHFDNRPDIETYLIHTDTGSVLLPVIMVSPEMENVRKGDKLKLTDGCFVGKIDKIDGTSLYNVMHPDYKD